MSKNRHKVTLNRFAGIHKLLRILMVICFLGLLYSCYILMDEKHEYSQGDEAYALLRIQAENQLTAEKDVISVPAAIAVNPVREINFSALIQVNSEVVAWISSEDRIIDYPIVQGTDNEYYLTHLFSGKKNKLGSLFVDYRTAGDFSGQTTIVYGHNMKDGSMFSSLAKYKDQEYFDKHPSMRLYTPSGVYTLEFFAGIVADGDYEFIRHQFHDDQDFLTYIDALKKDSTFMSDVSVAANERIVALCTCSYEFNNARYALFGKLVRAE